jgi:aryl-alcohol dehydrogenase-like predicted oxidoreductase
LATKDTYKKTLLPQNLKIHKINQTLYKNSVPKKLHSKITFETMTLAVKHALRSVVGNEKIESGLGFGCMGVTSFYGDSMPDDKAIELLQAVYDGGVRHFDTAEIYQQDGKFNESILGVFFKTVPRDSYCIATKYMPKGGVDDGEYDVVKKALTASLERLQLDHVDLYYSHRVLSLEGGKKFAETCNRLKEEGLIKEVGLSEVNGNWLRQINEICRIDVVQQEWSLMTRNLEAELVPVCKELGVVIVAYR